jgi:hypothetical protein
MSFPGFYLPEQNLALVYTEFILVDCVENYKLKDTLSNLLLEPTSTE